MNDRWYNFDNSFADQYIFNYSEPSNNEDDEIIPLVPEFGDASRSSFVVSRDWTLDHKRMQRGSDLKVGQIFSSKNDLVNVVKRWHIAHSVEYQV
jgi:hypothetical protein